ncbi:MAG: hypothetical protein ACREGJ_00660 [Candidatus Saccharimonadales bacterium]
MSLDDKVPTLAEVYRHYDGRQNITIRVPGVVLEIRIEGVMQWREGNSENYGFVGRVEKGKWGLLPLPTHKRSFVKVLCLNNGVHASCIQLSQERILLNTSPGSRLI